jgi:hypothetical protein
MPPEATIIASSSIDRIADLVPFGPIGRSGTVSQLFHFATVF